MPLFTVTKLQASTWRMMQLLELNKFAKTWNNQEFKAFLLTNESHHTLTPVLLQTINTSELTEQRQQMVDGDAAPR